MRVASSLAKPIVEESAAPFALGAAPKWTRWAALAFLAHFAISGVLATLLAVLPSSAENRILLVWLVERDRVVWDSSDFDPALCDASGEGIIAVAALFGLQFPGEMTRPPLNDTLSGGSFPITLKLLLSMIISAITLAIFVGLVASGQRMARIATGLIATYSLCAVGMTLMAVFVLTLQVHGVCGAG